MADPTENQAAFAVAYVANGGNGTEAAKAAGYSPQTARQQAASLLNKPHVRDAIHAEQARTMGTELASAAVGRLRQIINDQSAHPKIVLDAAKTILDRAGHVAPKAAEPEPPARKPLAEMSVQELEEFIRRGRETQAQDAARQAAAAGNAA